LPIGDMVFIDARGRFRTTDRKKDMTVVVRSGAAPRPPPARARCAEAAPAAKCAGASLLKSLARQFKSLATCVLGNLATAIDMAFAMAQSRIHRPGTKAAVEKGAALVICLMMVQPAALAQAASAPPNWAELEAAGARIGEIVVRSDDIRSALGGRRTMSIAAAATLLDVAFPV
jgi:hypothetical protein